MSSLVYLSKSDFQLASDCAKKLVYKKKGYATTNDSNEYMEMLAQGGYIIGKMATFLFPEGIEIEGKTQDCIDRTNVLLKQEKVVLFEAAILSGQKLIRVDVLVKDGNHFHLIEVKAKSYNSEELSKRGNITKYIEDVAFQYNVLSEVFPESQITCSLLMPDKLKRTNINNLAGWFSIKKNEKSYSIEKECLKSKQSVKFQKPDILFKYEDSQSKNHFTELLLNEGILGYMNVTKEVIELQPEIIRKTTIFLRILNKGISSTDYQINKDCKNCEFKNPNNLKDGYYECWGDLGYTEPNIFDLYYGGSIKNKSNGFYLNDLIKEGKTSLYDIDLECLKNSNGKIGSRGIRQQIQIENTKSNTEWISPKLKNYKPIYPLYFIDFETYTGAIPFHKGMRPYELIAFQWSCHTILYPGAVPIHSEWIHTGERFPKDESFPNFEFGRSLMNQIGNEGTPFMWATHENTVLKTILEQMQIYGIKDAELELWLISMTKTKDNNGRLIDMNKLTQEYYFHPYMKGRTSIKKVLPAIWSNNPYLHLIDYFKSYVPDSFVSGVLDPYDTLTSEVVMEDWDDEIVKGGTAAMRAYYRLRFDISLNKKEKDELRFQLLQYCKLDTMAMVIIAHHWGIK